MVSSTSDLISQPVNREEIIPSRKRIKLPAWLEVAKPRLIPLLLATTVGGMALSEEWPLPLNICMHSRWWSSCGCGCRSS